MKVDRLESLRDAIFAISMTLLVLDLKFPSQIINFSVLTGLIVLIPKFLSYLISFIVLGILWVGHHNQMHFVEKTDRLYLWLNMFFFFSISLIPFSASLLGDFPLDRVSIIFYSINLIFAGVSLFTIWNYAVRHNLIEKELKVEFIRSVNIRILLPPTVYIFAILMSFVKPEISLFLFIIPLILTILPGSVDRFLH